MIFFSCKKDDTNITNIPLEDLSQQYTLENDSIIQFMKSHFFNYDDFNDLSPNDSPEIVFDSIIEDLPDELCSEKAWGVGDNPKTALREYLKLNADFSIDETIQDKLLITVAPDGYLERV